MRILFAPDYRDGLGYQQLLADALAKHGVQVSFLSHYRRGLPLSRGVATHEVDAVHIHWPEKYFSKKGDLWDRLRVLRYNLDLGRTAAKMPIFLTAHNLLPHNRGDEPGVFDNVKATAQTAVASFVHSPAAREDFASAFQLADDRTHVIPYGDHAVTMGAPLRRSESRRRLKLPSDEKVCLMFGTISPYKGYEDILRFWVENNPPAKLVLAGPILKESYADELRAIAGNHEKVDLRISDQWLRDEDLRQWLSAVDCTIFNYKAIFTSGAAGLARSFGVPILIPNRLSSADLGEPHSHVIRFDAPETDFNEKLLAALRIEPNYRLAEGWRDATSWETVAEITHAVYSQYL